MTTQSPFLKLKKVVTVGTYRSPNLLTKHYLKNGKQRNGTSSYGNTRSDIFPYRRAFGYHFRSTPYNISIIFRR